MSYQQGRSATPRSWQEIRRLMDKEIQPLVSVPTGIETLDDVFGGGLPKGLIVFYGPSGSGKSEIASRIALGFDKVAYIYSESTDDIQKFRGHKNIHTFDYVSYTPMWNAAVQEVFTIIQEMKPELVIIDSITDFLGINKAMMEETDLRHGMKMLHRGALNTPIIAISEVRGQGFNQSTAGGEGVKHNSTMVVELGHEFADYEAKAVSLGIDVGEEIYTLRVEKRKGGGAKTGRYAVILQGEDSIELVKITPKRIRRNGDY